MITKEKFEELRQRMVNHKIINDTAIVELTAKELEDLLNMIEEMNKLYKNYSGIEYFDD